MYEDAAVFWHGQTPDDGGPCIESVSKAQSMGCGSQREHVYTHPGLYILMILRIVAEICHPSMDNVLCICGG